MSLTWSALLLAAALAQAESTSEVEARIVEYLKAEVRPGQRVVVSELVNEVFTSEEERAVLGRLFNTFFKIPLFAAQFQQSQGRPPTLAELSEQFGFQVPGEARCAVRRHIQDSRLCALQLRELRSPSDIHLEPIRASVALEAS